MAVSDDGPTVSSTECEASGWLRQWTCRGPGEDEVGTARHRAQVQPSARSGLLTAHERWQGICLAVIGALGLDGNHFERSASKRFPSIFRA